MYQKQRIFVSLVQANNILEQPLEDEPSLRSMSRRKSKCGRLRSTEYHSLPILSLMQPSQLSPTVSLDVFPVNHEGITPLLQPIKDSIPQHFLSSLTGQNGVSDLECEFLALPCSPWWSGIG